MASPSNPILSIGADVQEFQQQLTQKIRQGTDAVKAAEREIAAEQDRLQKSTDAAERASIQRRIAELRRFSSQARDSIRAGFAAAQEGVGKLADPLLQKAAQLRAAFSLGIPAATLAEQRRTLVAALEREVGLLRERGDLSSKELATLRRYSLELERQKNALKSGGPGVTGGTLDALRQGLANLAPGLARAGTLVEGLGASSAAAGGPLGVLIGLVAAAAAGLLAFGKAGGEAFEHLGNLSLVTGLSTRQTQIFIELSKQLGVEGETAARAIARMQAELGKYLRGVEGADPETAKFVEKLRALGVTVTDSTGKLRPIVEILGDASEALREIPDPAERTARALDLVGSRGIELVPLLINARGSFRELSKSVEEIAPASDFARESLGFLDEKLDEAFAILRRVKLETQGVAAAFVTAGLRVREFLTQQPAGPPPVPSFVAPEAGEAEMKRILDAQLAAARAIAAGSRTEVALEDKRAALAEAIKDKRVEEARQLAVQVRSLERAVEQEREREQLLKKIQELLQEQPLPISEAQRAVVEIAPRAELIKTDPFAKANAEYLKLLQQRADAFGSLAKTLEGIEEARIRRSSRTEEEAINRIFDLRARRLIENAKDEELLRAQLAESEARRQEELAALAAKGLRERLGIVDQILGAFDAITDVVGKFSGGLSKALSEASAIFQILRSGVSSASKAAQDTAKALNLPPETIEKIKTVSQLFTEAAKQGVSFTKTLKTFIEEGGLQGLVQLGGAIVGAFRQSIAGGIGALLQTVGSFLPGPAGAVFQGVGVGLQAISGIFSKGARKISQQVTKAVNEIISKFNEGGLKLREAIAALEKERREAIQRLSGKKGGQKQLNSLLPQIDQQLAQLRRQAKEIIDGFAADLRTLRLPEALRDVGQQLESIQKRIKEFLDAGGGALAAQEFLARSLQQLYKDINRDLRDSELEVIDLLKKEIDLHKEREKVLADFAERERAIRRRLGIERPLTPAQEAARDIAELNKQRDEQLERIDTELELLDAQLEGRRELFELGSSEEALQKRRLGLLRLENREIGERIRLLQQFLSVNADLFGRIFGILPGAIPLLSALFNLAQGGSGFDPTRLSQPLGSFPPANYPSLEGLLGGVSAGTPQPYVVLGGGIRTGDLYFQLPENLTPSLAADIVRQGLLELTGPNGRILIPTRR